MLPGLFHCPAGAARQARILSAAGRAPTIQRRQILTSPRETACAMVVSSSLLSQLRRSSRRLPLMPPRSKSRRAAQLPVSRCSKARPTAAAGPTNASTARAAPAASRRSAPTSALPASRGPSAASPRPFRRANQRRSDGEIANTSLAPFIPMLLCETPKISCGGALSLKAATRYQLNGLNFRGKTTWTHSTSWQPGGSRRH